MREKKPISIRERYSSSLSIDPDLGKVSMNELLGVLIAMKHNFTHHYDVLSQHALSASSVINIKAFNELKERELIDIKGIIEIAASLNLEITNSEDYSNMLPFDLDQIWTDLYGSALVSPYRIYAAAVLNKVRTSTYLSYLTAHAATEEVRLEAERQAYNKLMAASELRKLRRKAWQQEKTATGMKRMQQFENANQFDNWLEQKYQNIYACQTKVKQRLIDLGATAQAQIIESYLQQTSGDLKQGKYQPDGHNAHEANITENVNALVLMAQRPLEQLTEDLQTISNLNLEEDLYNKAINALEESVSLYSLWSELKQNAA